MVRVSRFLKKSAEENFSKGTESCRVLSPLRICSMSLVAKGWMKGLSLLESLLEVVLHASWLGMLCLHHCVMFEIG